MDYVLLDIKNFLKKLENGQLEIEAGQWELHKDLTNMKLAIGEIKNMKEDVEKMRLNSVQQLSLIKALQGKIETIKQNRMEDRPLTVSERSVTYEKVYRRPPDGLSPPKGYKKKKSHVIRSEEIIEITSRMSNDKSESDREESVSKANEPILKVPQNGRNQRDSESGSIESFYREASQIIPPQTKSNSCSPNNDILQRYLKDSAKYVDRKRSNTTELTYSSLSNTRSKKLHSEVGHTTFWDEYGSRAQSNGNYENQNSPRKEYFSETVKTGKSVTRKKLACSKCPRKFKCKTDFLRHEKEHQKAEAVHYCKVCGKNFWGKHWLRKHEAVHKASSRSSKGFKCSYCSKICSTPEKLTSHLRKCRIIMRYHFKRK